MVPSQAATEMEDPRIEALVPALRLGSGGRLLEPLPVVLQAARGIIQEAVGRRLSAFGQKKNRGLPSFGSGDNGSRRDW